MKNGINTRRIVFLQIANKGQQTEVRGQQQFDQTVERTVARQMRRESLT